jgi:hypothetical protein
MAAPKSPEPIEYQSVLKSLESALSPSLRESAIREGTFSGNPRPRETLIKKVDGDDLIIVEYHDASNSLFSVDPVKYIRSSLGSDENRNKGTPT